jgi:hypothetical protein
MLGSWRSKRQKPLTMEQEGEDVDHQATAIKDSEGRVEGHGDGARERRRCSATPGPKQRERRSESESQGARARRSGVPKPEHIISRNKAHLGWQLQSAPCFGAPCAHSSMSSSWMGKGLDWRGSMWACVSFHVVMCVCMYVQFVSKRASTQDGIKTMWSGVYSRRQRTRQHHSGPCARCAIA